jgi:thiol-disulfide isomerase/thioredoxin
MPERILIFSVIVLLMLLILKYFKRSGRRKVNLNLLASEGIDPGNNRPSLIYFWSESCIPCTFQSKIFLKLKENYRNVNFISLNAVEKKELASDFSIRTVPSIALLSSGNEMKFLSHGFTGEETLKKVLDEIN